MLLLRAHHIAIKWSMAESSSGVVAAAKQTSTKRASCKFTNLGFRAGNRIKYEILHEVQHVDMHVVHVHAHPPHFCG